MTTTRMGLLAAGLVVLVTAVAEAITPQDLVSVGVLPGEPLQARIMELVGVDLPAGG